MGNILQSASVKSSVMEDLYEVMDYGEELIQEENTSIDEMANVRGERQKSVLLEKVPHELAIADSSSHCRHSAAFSLENDRGS